MPDLNLVIAHPHLVDLSINQISPVHHVTHVHPRVLKGVRFAAGRKVERAWYLLDEDKP